MTQLINRDDVQRLVGEGAQLVEVLPAQEYDEQHLAGAQSLPLKQLNAKSATRLNQERPIIVYCYDFQ